MFGENIENLSAGAHVLHLTSNLVISHFKNVKCLFRACKAFVSVH